MNVAKQRDRRAQWAQHPNFPDHILLVGSHDNFRRASQLIIDELEHHDPPRYAERLFRRWMMGMSGHEHYEESKLYPYLSHRWGRGMEHLQSGHDELHAQRAKVYAAFDEVIELGDNAGAAGDRLRAAYLRFHETLLAHLELEEDTVVPLLLDLEPAEFRQLTTHSIRHLLETTDAHAPAES